MAAAKACGWLSVCRCSVAGRVRCPSVGNATPRPGARSLRELASGGEFEDSGFEILGMRYTAPRKAAGGQRLRGSCVRYSEIAANIHEIYDIGLEAQGMRHSESAACSFKLKDVVSEELEIFCTL